MSRVPVADEAEIRDWFVGRLPTGWFSDLTVTIDREEITVVGVLADEEAASQSEAEGRIGRFRAETRERRVEIAREAQARFERTVSWGVEHAGTRALFTHLAVPVMTRLRQPERRVLDTLVDAGVARSRSDALGWAVRLVGEHTQEWLAELRAAMTEVEKVRRQGPGL